MNAVRGAPVCKTRQAGDISVIPHDSRQLLQGRFSDQGHTKSLTKGRTYCALTCCISGHQVQVIQFCATEPAYFRGVLLIEWHSAIEGNVLSYDIALANASFDLRIFVYTEPQEHTDPAKACLVPIHCVSKPFLRAPPRLIIIIKGANMKLLTPMAPLSHDYCMT